MTLFVLHDSGLLGLGAFLGLIGTVARLGRRALQRDGGGEPRLAASLLVAGAGLFFTYQFTHVLWVMWPYVYLGCLTAAVTGDAQQV